MKLARLRDMADIVYGRSYYWSGYPSNIISSVINTIVGIIEFLLALRLVLSLLGASSSAPFVAWIYDLTGRLVGPFAGAFPNLNLGGITLELSTIFAMIGYAIIGWLVMWLLSLLFPTRTY